MSDAVVEQPPSTDSVDVVADDLSLEDHEAAFGPADPSLTDEAKVQAETKRERIRHRAASQQATPEDIVKISAYTARAKAAEDAAGIKRETGESERVYRLRVRAELAERAKTPSASVEQVQPRIEQPAQRTTQQQQTGPEPTRPKPSEDEIGDKYPTHAAFVEDLTDWKFEQRIAAAQQTYQQQQATEAQAQVQREFNAALDTYRGRAKSFMAKHADFDDLVKSNATINFPPAVFKSIIQDDNGPAFMYHLLTHPDQLAEVVTLWDEKLPSDVHVANATRWLSSRAQAVITGSAAPTPPLPPASRPPNPVRTGPMKTGDELPGDDSSLAEHTKAFGPKRRS